MTVRTWRRPPTARRSQADAGLAADSNSVYFVTGNGPFDANTGGADYGDSAIKLGSTFSVSDYFTPCNQAALFNQDVDGPALGKLQGCECRARSPGDPDVQP